MRAFHLQHILVSLTAYTICFVAGVSICLSSLVYPRYLNRVTGHLDTRPRRIDAVANKENQNTLWMGLSNKVL